jgi:hypothetical protein
MLKMQKNAIKWYIAALGCKSEAATILFQSNIPSASKSIGAAERCKSFARILQRRPHIA